MRKIIAGIDDTAPTEDEIDQLVRVMNSNEEDGNSEAAVISLNDFSSAISSFIVFEVADENGSGSIDIKELKVRE